MTAIADDLVERLTGLGLRLRALAIEGVASGPFLPEEEVVFRRKFDKFEYGDTGVANFQWHGERGVRRTWYRAWGTLTKQAPGLEEYSAALNVLKSQFGNDARLGSHLEAFTNRLVWEVLENSAFGEDDVDGTIRSFLKNLRDEPVKYSATVELQGIAMRPEEARLNHEASIRRPQIKDLEAEVPLVPFLGASPLGLEPSVILSVEIRARHGRELQEEIEKIISLLRLFKVGSVVWSSYQMRSESVTDRLASGAMRSGRETHALETYLLTDDDLPRIRKFWGVCEKSVPSAFYDFGRTSTDHMTIAYNRYVDALLQNGIIERRIANSVMGLEALFLKGGEVQELSYRLTMRVAKFLSLFSYDQHQVRARLVDAYRVRNLFAHGSQLSYRERKRLEGKYKDVKSLLLEVLDYVRVCLVAMTLVRKGKEEMVDMVDDSLIDRRREEQLNTLFSQAQEILLSV